MDSDRIRRDFDEIARLAGDSPSSVDRYDSFLSSLVPHAAADVLEVGSGLGRLAIRLAKPGRRVTGIDISAIMVERARKNVDLSRDISFVCADFLECELAAEDFDCVLSAATLHHMPADAAVFRMATLLRPGGRLIIHDLRATTGPLQAFKLFAAISQDAFRRFWRTRRLLNAAPLRQAWARHGAGEKYLTLSQARVLARRLLPGESQLIDHWRARYTLVWDKPRAAC